MEPSLPIEPLLPEVVAALRGGQDIVLQAEPGAGKTTRVPAALLESGLLGGGACWVLEPRRLAARMAAARVAETRGEALGGLVGYAVRFEQRVSSATLVRYVTEGLFLRHLQAHPDLRGVAVVILDEFHERHLHTDLALALVRQLQRTSRPDLRLVVMSATLEGPALAERLGATFLACKGRAHPVAIEHLARPEGTPLAQQVAQALARVVPDLEGGHALVFLPGAAEIRQALSACAPLAEARGLALLPLHGSLSFEAQKAAVAPSATSKVLLSTNVAESSLTIPGVRVVVDSGLGREAHHGAWSGFSRLGTVRISQARCVQRAGRAGREGPGRCLRLFTEADFLARAPYDAPEILRADWAEGLMLLLALGGLDITNLPWLDTPSPEGLQAATRLLTRLGAMAPGQGLSAIGQRMATLPLHPRLARLVVAGEDLGIPHLARMAAVLLEAGDLRRRASLGDPRGVASHDLDCDLWPRLDAFLEIAAAGFSASSQRLLGLDGAVVSQARQTLRDLGGREVDPSPAEEARLLQALLRAYPDRVARSGGRGTYRLVGGGGARLDGGSRCQRQDLVLALEAEEVVRGAGREVVIQTASRVEPEWLLEAFPDSIREWDTLAFNPAGGIVERRSGLAYEDLVLDETRRRAEPGDPRVAACLAEAVASKGLGEAGETVERWLDRVAFTRAHRPDLGLPDRESLLQGVRVQACAGCASLRDLGGVDWVQAFRETLGRDAFRVVEGFAPDTVGLPRRRVRVEYGGDSPSIASPLQDFLGMKEGPRIGGGSVPLVLHLLAPNQRAVQVTMDLAGFWQRAYQELRPQLSRRYPRHEWPERPA